jgi:hypothetical protein
MKKKNKKVSNAHVDQGKEIESGLSGVVQGKRQ